MTNGLDNKMKVEIIDFKVRFLKQENGEKIYFIVNPFNGEVLKVNELTLRVINQLKISKCLMCAINSLKSEGIDITMEDLSIIIKLLREAGFLVNKQGVAPTKDYLLAFELKSEKINFLISLFRKLSKLKIHFALPIIIVPFLVIIPLKLPRYLELIPYLFNPDTSLWPLLLLILLNLLTIGLHEMAHALIYFYYGGEKVTIGLTEEYGLIMPFTRLHLIDMLDEYKQVRIFLAGPITSLLLTSIYGYYLFMFESFLSIELKSVLAFMIIFQLSAIIFSVYPGIRSDAYFAISAWLKFPNLYEKSIRYLKNKLRSLLWGANIANVNSYDLIESEKNILRYFSFLILVTMPLVYIYLLLMLILAQFPIIVSLIYSKLYHPNLKLSLILVITILNALTIVYGFFRAIKRKLSL